MFIEHGPAVTKRSDCRGLCVCRSQSVGERRSWSRTVYLFDNLLVLLRIFPAVSIRMAREYMMQGRACNGNAERNPGNTMKVRWVRVRLRVRFRVRVTRQHDEGPYMVHRSHESYKGDSC
jgi:hypothetical protein